MDDGPSKKNLNSKPTQKYVNFLEGLKNEWNLFWHTLVEDENSTLDAAENETSENAVETEAEIEAEQKEIAAERAFEKMRILSDDQVKTLIKALSVDRRKINQKLESLNKEIDLHSVKLESLRLVGSDTEDVIETIEALTSLGVSLNQQLEKINERLRMARDHEIALKREAEEALDSNA